LTLVGQRIHGGDATPEGTVREGPDLNAAAVDLVTRLDAPVSRVAAPDAPAPAAAPLEEAYIPSVERIEEAVWQTLRA